MDMGSMTMDIDNPTPSSTAISATTSMAMAATASDTCKISMLWNWYTIDACFISKTWRITSSGMFAGSCIGVVFLVMFLEFLRRLSKEYDRHLIRQHKRPNPDISCAPACQQDAKSASKESDPRSHSEESNKTLTVNGQAPFRPNVCQQAVRATLHMLQFGVAYIIMLLAMYYNGYIILSIITGAWIGAFLFTWETVTLSGPQEEATICCG